MNIKEILTENELKQILLLELGEYSLFFTKRAMHDFTSEDLFQALDRLKPEDKCATWKCHPPVISSTDEEEREAVLEDARKLVDAVFRFDYFKGSKVCSEELYEAFLKEVFADFE